MSRTISETSEYQSGFRLGPWHVVPHRNAIVQGEVERHLENRVMQTLVFLAVHQGEVVSREEFFNSVWKGRVVNEEALSRAMSLLRTALDDNAHKPKYVQTVPGTGYRLIVEVLRNQGPTDTETPTADTQQNSIAVLPFVNFSDDPGNEYFSDGISEEILNSLANVERFKVVGRTSSFAFKGRNEDLRLIGRTLDVSHVLEGSVRKAGPKVRITAQLINTRDGFHLWSETFDRGLEDIFAVQDEIANAVVNALKINLLGEIPKSRETGPEAYPLYLQGRYFLQTGELQGMEKAVDVFKRALDIDPDFAPAWVGLATAYWHQVSHGERMREEGMPRALEASARAVALDDDLAEAHICEALLSTNFLLDWSRAKRAIGRALELAPGSAPVVLQAGNLASSLGRFEEAVTLLRQAISLDPLNTTGHIWLSLNLITLKRFDEACETLQQLLKLNSQRVVAHFILGKILLFQEDAEAAHEEMLKEPEGFWRDFGTILSLYALRRNQEADEAFRAFVDAYAVEAPFQIAEIYCHCGDLDSAFDSLERAYELHDNGLTELLGNPFMTVLHDDPRWLALVHKMGYPESV